MLRTRESLLLWGMRHIPLFVTWFKAFPAKIFIEIYSKQCSLFIHIRATQEGKNKYAGHWRQPKTTKAIV